MKYEFTVVLTNDLALNAVTILKSKTRRTLLFQQKQTVKRSELYPLG